MAETRQQTEDLQRLAAADPGLLRVADERLDRAVARRFIEFERGARQREWMIGTVVAVAAGIVAILLSHYLFAFSPALPAGTGTTDWKDARRRTGDCCRK